MAIGMLSDDLMSLPGVEYADLDGDPMTPAGIRVRLSRGVDASAVEGDVRRILERHGLRPDIGNADSASPKRVDSDEASMGENPEAPDNRSTETVVDGPVVVFMAGVGLASVGNTEGSDGIVVTATGAEDHASLRASGLSLLAVDEAVVHVVAELAGTSTRPRICSIDERELDGTSVVTVVIEERGERLVGSAVVRSGRAYAVGRAVWTALSSR